VPHSEAEELILVAGGEPHPEVAAHVRGCRSCQAELRALRETVTLLREADAMFDSERRIEDQLPDRIWDGIASQLALSGRRPERGLRRRLVAAAAAGVLAGALAGAGAVVATESIAGRDGAAAVVARATLATVPGAPPGPTVGSGSATVVVDDGGSDVVEVSATLPAPASGYYEVWLGDPTLRRLYSLGALDGSGTGRFALPPGVRLTEFTTIDVSAEEHDGDPGHSTVSVLRGTLG